MIRCKRKGITLSEVCIVLAVVSIVSLAVVSFAAMATGRGATGTDKLKVMQDIELLEAMVDNWFTEVYTTPGCVTAGEGDTLLQQKNGKQLKIRWSGSTLILDFLTVNAETNEEEVVSRTYRFETVESISFSVIDRKNGEAIEDEIFFCKVTYAYRRGQNTPVEETYTFCINPRVGESITK